MNQLKKRKDNKKHEQVNRQKHKDMNIRNLN